MDFFRFRNKLVPQKGRLLISEPFLPDPHFERTIILLCEHNEEGSFGFVLNKPSETSVEEVVQDIERHSDRVYIGGPVQQDTLHFIHRHPELEESTEIAKGIYWGGSFERLILLLQTRQIDASDVKFFVGYSGWSAGQLEEELQADSWIVSDQTSDGLYVFCRCLSLRRAHAPPYGVKIDILLG